MSWSTTDGLFLCGALLLMFVYHSWQFYKTNSRAEGGPQDGDVADRKDPVEPFDSDLS